jgi:hypothetical protein
MTTRVDDRTQVQRVSLKAEAKLLETWLKRREQLERTRRDGPTAALAHRVALLEREVPRLSAEVEALSRPAPRRRSLVGALLVGTARGALFTLGLAAWVAGTALLTPGAKNNDPLRLASVFAMVGVIAFARN